MNKIDIKELQLSRKNLTTRYQTEHQTNLLTTAERKVYLQSRMPATQAVCEQVFRQIDNRMNISSFLDLGCGPGSATHAALKIFSNLTTLHMIDKDKCYDYYFSQPYQFFEQNFENLNIILTYDLIAISYALSECTSGLVTKVLHKAWQSTNKYLVIIEPGTTFGYSSFLKARQYLIEQGAFIIAPCPHELTCPLVNPDWCHFKTRLHRSKIHQQIKQGTRSFEDESYTFGIFSKQPIQIRKKTIIKKPIKRIGNIVFNLCTADGVQTEIISRKNKICYTKAKKLVWGYNFL